MNKEQILERIEEIKTEIIGLGLEMDSQIEDANDADLYETEYCEMLDEQGPVEIAGIEYDVGSVLHKIDIIAYREGLSNFADSLIREKQDEIETDFSDQIYDLESEIEDLESEIEDLDK